MSVDTNLIDGINSMMEGKEEGFNVLYSYTYDYVYRRAKYIMKNEQDALDLTQETYIQAYNNIDTLKNVNNIYAWLGAIVYRQGMKILRQRREILVDEEAEYIFEDLVSENVELNPEAAALQRNTSEIVKTIIEQLPEAQRIAIMAYYFDNMKIEDIAETQECSANTIKSRLNYAKKYIKEQVEVYEKKYKDTLYAFTPAVIGGAITMLIAEDVYAMPENAIGNVYKEACQKIELQSGSGVNVPNGQTSTAGIGGNASGVEANMAGLGGTTYSAGIVGTSAVKAAGIGLAAKIALAVCVPVVAIGGTILGVSAYQNAQEKKETAERREETEYSIESQVAVETEIETESGTEVSVIEEIEEAVVQPEWVQAYKDFLNDPVNLYMFLTYEYDFDYLGERDFSSFEGFCLHDFDADNIPELILCDAYERIEVYAYCEPDPDTDRQAKYKKGWVTEYYNLMDDSPIWGFDKETGTAYTYYESFVEDQKGMEIRFERMSLEDEDPSSLIEWQNSSNLRYDEWFPGERGDSFRQELWKDLSVGQEVPLMQNFVPFKWRSLDEIDTYINADYRKSNLEGENIQLNQLYKEPEAYDLDQILKESSGNDLYTAFKDEMTYIDKKRLIAFHINRVFFMEEVTDYEVTINAPDGYVNFRYGPGTEYGLIESIQNGEVMDVMYETSDGNWCGISYNGMFGWVARSQVQSDEDVAEERGYTEEEEMKIRRAFGVPDELEGVIVEKGDSYYWEAGDCIITNISIYHEGNYVAGGTVTEDLEAVSVYSYTPVE